ncbi:hypothetical protein WEN_02355 [Mycoplasma wenyonii str. Massachusetts]|uniref:Uncharacterized protein n=1 Tax=Mycoplasma wenyonii (strain Massachusetts) TaxID=1197325 RepID=I6Z6R0_MYCWM|nr:hypothetical protein [Mycoplasma wenyonii]AFN65258.1 hypothetical protein WEN_02355 [Mycoplasma wenyonii str. Massachusetts]
MKSVFSWGLFKEQLREDLSVFEFSFLKRVFSQTAFCFGVFGVLVCSLTALAEASWFKSLFDQWTYVAPVGGLLALVTGLALMFYYLPKYHSNPLEVTPKFVKRAYFCLICTYGIVFCVILKGLSWASLIAKNESLGWIGGSTTLLGMCLFGTTLLVYAIPVLIGLGMKKHSSALKLSRFLRACYIAYFVLFLVGLVVSLSMSAGAQMGYHFLITLLCGAIIFTAPVLSVYRMKTVIRYIDQRDMVAIKKWELFFVFEALAQLMQMAIYLVRLLFSLCSGCLVSSERK